MNLGFEKPSKLRVAVAITVTVICMVLSCLGVSKYLEYRDRNNHYYPLGKGSSLDVYTQELSIGEAEIIGKRIVVLECTETVKRGNIATVRILGDPGETYGIDVHLKSGISKSAALGDKIADEKGVVEWEWRVSGNTTPGHYAIIIHREDSEYKNVTYAKMYFTITE